MSLFSWLRFVGLARAFLSSWSMVILVLSMKFSSGSVEILELFWHYF